MNKLGESFVIPGMRMRKGNVATTPARIIFFRHYPVIVSGLDMLDEHCVEKFGLPSVGKNSDNVAMLSKPRYANMTIAAMAIFVKDGARIALASNKDADEIFSVIHEHLSLWSREVNSSFNSVHIPLEGLRELEDLAQHLYVEVMRQRKTTGTESYLVRSVMDYIRHSSPITNRTLELQKQSDPNPVDDSIVPYKSISGDLGELLEKRGFKSWS